MMVGGKAIVSCTEPIDLSNAGMESLLVINCILTDTIYENNFHASVAENNVVIQKTTPYFGEVFTNYVSGAKVWLNDKSLTMSSVGIYSPGEGFKAVSGQTYSLVVHYDMDGDGVEEVYTSTTTVPQKCHLDSVSLFSLNFTSEFFAYLRLHFQGFSGKNYFGAKLNNENDIRTYSNRILRYYVFGEFDILDGDEEYQRLLASEWLIRKEMAYDNQDKYYIYAGDTLSVTLEALSEEYHRFLEVAKVELSQNIPLFSPPRSNVPTNIQGGAIGIFGAYTASHAEVVIPLSTPGLPKRPKD